MTRSYHLEFLFIGILFLTEPYRERKKNSNTYVLKRRYSYIQQRIRKTNKRVHHNHRCDAIVINFIFDSFRLLLLLFLLKNVRESLNS
jgi:hypothetical protein